MGGQPSFGKGVNRDDLRFRFEINPLSHLNSWGIVNIDQDEGEMGTAKPMNFTAGHSELLGLTYEVLAVLFDACICPSAASSSCRHYPSAVAGIITE